ncbi:MAG: phosphodiester glycosidase family protein [Chloroflexi bacterium]|nr:phosphodiester glycosidase family protein [Chloroflexota bacterium]
MIGQDVNGRIFAHHGSRGGFTLHQLSTWLTASDLELDIALNLDGGPSTGLVLADPSLTIPAFSTLPIVLPSLMSVNRYGLLAILWLNKF